MLRTRAAEVAGGEGGEEVAARVIERATNELVIGGWIKRKRQVEVGAHGRGWRGGLSAVWRLLRPRPAACHGSLVRRRRERMAKAMRRPRRADTCWMGARGLGGRAGASFDVDCREINTAHYWV